MAISGITNLLESIANQQFGLDPLNSNGANPVQPTVNNDPQANNQDTFTPANQNVTNQDTAQAAGLFQLTQFAAIADFVQLQQTAPQPAQAAVPATPAAEPPAVPQTNVAPNPATTVVVAAPTQPASPAVAANTNATPSSSQNQLQTLNTALSELGLNTTEIDQIDQIASIIQNFSPQAFSDLVYQLHALSQTATQQTAATSVGGPTATGNAGAFQLQELAIRFTGAQGTVNNAVAPGNGTVPGATGNTTQVKAFSLQVEEVQLTLATNAGQTLQVQATQPNTGAATGNQTTSSANAPAA